MAAAFVRNGKLPFRHRHTDERESSDIAHIAATARERIHHVDLSHMTTEIKRF